MMKKRIPLFAAMLLAAFAASCESVQTVLKSGRPEVMFQRGKEFYGKEKWSKAATLFEGAAPYYIGSAAEDSLAFMHAYSKFRTREYGTSSAEFDIFRRKFPNSVFAEEAERLLAQSYFFMAPGPTRDQGMTSQALVTINEFLAHYPASAHTEEFREADKLLTERLHDKAYLNAYTYYKIKRYKSAIVALKNALKLYPQSAHREQIMYLIVKSSYELAANSVADKQTDRYLSMLDSYYSFVAEFPASDDLRDLERMAGHAKDYLEKNKTEEK